MSIFTALSQLRYVGFGRVVVAVLSATVSSAAEPEFVASHQKMMASNPAGVTFSIVLVDGKTRFHVGELIPLDIVYQFDKVGELLINDSLCRDSGTDRLLEVMHATPKSGTRSMAWDRPNFHSWAGGSPVDVKTGRTYRYRVYLNEWRRFDSPGRYRFYSESARIWKPKVYPHHDNDVRVTSNELELEIVAAEIDWQIDQVKQAVEGLENDIKPVENDEKQEQARQQRRRVELKRLRYLDTELATRQLARQESGGEDLESYETGMGLFQSRYKAAAVEELERRLASPDFAVTASYVRQLARLAADVQMPIDESMFNTSADSLARLEKLQLKHDELEQSLHRKYSEAARVAAESKSPLVRARSLLQRLPTWPVDFRREPHPPAGDELARIRDAVVQQFEHLSEEEQTSILSIHWRRLGGPEFLPVLRKHIAAAPARPQMHHGETLFDLALNRLWDLSPDEGSALALAEMKRPIRRAAISTFKRLPSRPNPDLDDLLIERLENAGDNVEYEDQEVAAMMLAHLGSPAVYGRVRRIYDKNRQYYWTNLPAALLAYLIRHNPDEGTRLINQAIDDVPAKEHWNVLGSVAKAFKSPDLESIAIQRLDDKDLKNVKHAAFLLGSYGTQRGEQALWRRMEKWNADWKDRAVELNEASAGDPPNPQIELEQSVVYVLSRSDTWFIEASALRRLRALCLIKPNQDDADRMIDAWSQPITIRLFPGTNGEFPSAVITSGIGPLPNDDTWNVAQYMARTLSELKTLLGRFPTGTTFSFPTGILTDEAAEKVLFDDLKGSLTSRGYELVKSTPPE